MCVKMEDNGQLVPMALEWSVVPMVFECQVCIIKHHLLLDVTSWCVTGTHV